MDRRARLDLLLLRRLPHPRHPAEPRRLLEVRGRGGGDPGVESVCRGGGGV